MCGVRKMGVDDEIGLQGFQRSSWLEEAGLTTVKINSAGLCIEIMST